jgi:hypothetical protein
MASSSMDALSVCTPETITAHRHIEFMFLALQRNS